MSEHTPIYEDENGERWLTTDAWDGVEEGESQFYDHWYDLDENEDLWDEEYGKEKSACNGECDYCEFCHDSITVVRGNFGEEHYISMSDEEYETKLASVMSFNLAFFGKTL